MSNLSDTLSQQLASRDLSLQDWKLLLQRLLDYGVLCRDDSQVEAEFYDQFVRIEPLVDDYLSLIGVRFQHDKHFHYVRLIPPGARLAGVDDENDEPYNGGFRQRLSQHEVAMVLVLRAEYDKALREGAIDEQGCTAISLEAITLSMKNLLKRALPEQMVERRQVFKKLRQLRLIHFVNEADLEQGESWIKIRPLIINLVSNEWLDAIRQDAKLGSDIVSQSQTDSEEIAAPQQSSSIEDTSIKIESALSDAEELPETSQPDLPAGNAQKIAPPATVESEVAVVEKKTPARKKVVKEPVIAAKAKLAAPKTSAKKSPAVKDPTAKSVAVKSVATKATSTKAPIVKKPIAKKASVNTVAAAAKTAKVAGKTGNKEKPVPAQKTNAASKPVKAPAKKVVAKKSTAKSTLNDA